MANTYYRGQGKLWIATRDSSGRTSGFTEIGDAEAFNVTTSEQFDSVYESQSGARAKVVHSSIQTDVNFSMTVLNFSPANLARSLLGTTGNVTGATIASEAHKAYKGGSIFLKYPGISAVTIGSLVAGTDYVVNAATGRIDFPTSSSIVDGASINVAYTHAGVEGAVETLVNADNREYVLVFEGKNMNQQGSPVIVRAHRAYMNLASQLSLLGTATNRFEISGSLLPDESITGAGLSKFMTVTVKDVN